MAIDAGTIIAYLDLDTNKFGNALQIAQGQVTAFAQEGTGLSGMIDGMGAAMTTVGRVMTMGVTVPLVGIGAAAVKTGMEFDQQMSRVRAISGATEEEFQILRQAAIDMGADSVFGATDAAKALEYMGMAGWKTQEMIEGLPGIINLAAASGEDLGIVSDIVTDSLTAFGLAAGDAAHFADVLAAAATNSNTNVTLMGYTFKYAAPLAGALGYSIEDCAVAIGLMANAGIKGEQAGTSLRSILTNLANPTDTVAGAMEQLGISLTDASGEIKPLSELLGDLRGAFGGLTEAQKVEAAASIAGKHAMSGLLAIVNAGEEDFVQLTEAVSDCAGAAEKMARIMLENLAGDVEEFSGAMETAAITLADFLNPALRNIIQTGTRVVDWFNALDTSVQNAIFRFGGLAAAIGPVLLVGGKLISAFSGVIPALALVGGGIALVYEHSERLQGIVERLKASMPEWLERARSGVEAFANALDMGMGVIDAGKAGIAAAFGPGATAGVIRVTSAIQTGFQAATAPIGAALDGAGAFLGSLIDGEGAAHALREGLLAAFGVEVASRVYAVLQQIGRGLDTVRNAAATFADAARSGFAALREELTRTAAGIAADYSEGGVLGVLSGLGETMGGLLQSGAEAVYAGALAIRERVGEGLALARDWLEPKAQAWMSNLGSALENAKDAALSRLPAIRDAIVEGLAVAQDAVTDTARKAMGWLGDAYRSGTAQGALGDLAAVGRAVWNRIGDAREAALTKAGEMLTALGTALGSSQALAAVGEISGVAAGLAQRITSNAGDFYAAAALMMGNLVAQLTDNGFLATAFSGLGSIVAAIAEGIGSAAANITGCAVELMTTLIGAFTQGGLVEGLFSTAGDVVSAIAGVIGGAAEMILPAAADIGSALVEGIAGLNWSSIFTSAGSVANSIVNLIGSSVSGAIDAASQIASALCLALGKVNWKGAFTAAGSIVGSIFDQLLAQTESFVAGATDIAKALATGLSDVDWGGIGSSLGTTATNLIDSLMKAMPDVIPGVADLVGKLGAGISGAASGLSEAAATLVGKLVGYLLSPSFLGDLFDVGASFVGAVGRGLVGTGQWLVETAADVGTSLIVGFSRGLLGVEVDPVLQALFDEFSKGFFTVFDALGNEVETSGAELALMLERSMLNSGEIDAALQAWQVVVSSGYAEAFEEAAWLANEAVVELYRQVADTTLSEGERAQALAVLIGFGYGERLQEAIDSTEPGISAALARLLEGGTAEMLALLEETGLTAGQLLGVSIPEGFTLGMQDGKAVLLNEVGEVVDIASLASEQAQLIAQAQQAGASATGAVADGERAAQGETEAASTAVKDGIVDAYAPLPEELTTLTGEAMAGVEGGILAGVDPATQAALQASDAVVQRFLLTMSADNGTQIGTGFTSAVTNAITAAQGAMSGAASQIAEAARQALTAILNHGTGNSIGSAMIQGVISGANSMGGALSSAMSALAASAVSAFKAALDMHSPPRVFVDIGEAIPDAVGLGVDRDRGAATDAILRMARDMEGAWGLELSGTNVTRNGHALNALAGDGGGYVFNFYGDMAVREDADIERIGMQFREEITGILRGGGAVG